MNIMANNTLASAKLFRRPLPPKPPVGWGLTYCFTAVVYCSNSFLGAMFFVPQAIVF